MGNANISGNMEAQICEEDHVVAANDGLQETKSRNRVAKPFMGFSKNFWPHKVAKVANCKLRKKLYEACNI